MNSIHINNKRDKAGNTLRQDVQPALVVCLGAPHSGLNLLTQCLRLIGFAMADDSPAGPALIHALLCRDLGISPWTAGSLPHGWQNTSAAQSAKQRIHNLLAMHAGASDPFVLADPFMARAFPIWLDVIVELNLQPRLIHLLRHPWEVARSLIAKENLDLTQAHILWLTYIRDASRFCQGHDHVLITFDQLLADPVTSLHAALMGEFGIHIPEALLLNHVQPELKHHHAGSAPEVETQRFASFIRVYDDQRLRQAAAGCQAAKSSHLGIVASHEKKDASGDEGILEAIFQLLGQYEAGYNEQRNKVNQLLGAPQTAQALFATVNMPIEKGKYTEHHFHLLSDQWQTLTVDIPRPDLLKNSPLRLLPLNTAGAATLSDVKFVDRTTNKIFWSIRTFDDSSFITLKGPALRLPSENNMVLFITGKEAELVFNGVRQLPDCPMRVEILIRVSVNPAIYHETLHAFLSPESWKAILGIDSKETDKDSLIRLAGAFEMAGCLMAADVVFQKGLEMHPESESLRIAFAELAMRRQSWAEAIRRWQEIAAFMGQNTHDFIYQRLDEAYRNQKSFPKGSLDEEARMGDGDKYEMLSLIHQVISPELYVEIGAQEGKSLALAQCKAIGIDPMPQVKVPLSENAQIVSITSDDFFKGPASGLLKHPPDLVFIDGMHFFEYALRDFRNVERFAAPWTLVVIDDIFPVHPAQAERRRRTKTWTGDVWKLYVILQEYRPDLFFLPINTSPTGLLLIAGLKKDNAVLWENYDKIVARYSTDMAPPAGIFNRNGVLTAKHLVIPEVLGILKNSRELRLDTKTIINKLKEKIRQA
ncbi:MAG: class I SAM-dependent methyltransferase [Desulfosalsimonadaceae bacterium]